MLQTEMNNLNTYKDSFIQIFEKLTGRTFNADDWDADFSINFDQELKKELEKLNAYAGLSKVALQHQDYVTAKVAFLHIRIHALNLSGFFDNIYEDLEKIRKSNRQLFPIPENFSIPKHYNSED